MQVKFNEVLKLSNAIQNAIRINSNQIRESITVSYCAEEQDKKVIPEVSIAEIFTKNSVLYGNLNKVKGLISKTNNEVTTEFENTIYTLNQLMMKRKELVELIGMMRYLVNTPQMSRRVVSNGKVEYTEATFNVKDAKKDMKTTEAKVRIIDGLLDSVNTSVSVEVLPEWFEL